MTDGSRHRYKKDPIAEAVCEFQFVPTSQWDLTVPGRIYELVKGEYSGSPTDQTAIETEVGSPEGGQTKIMRVKQGVTRILLPTEDGTRFIGIGRNTLTVHVKQPYPGWEDFKPRIERALAAYQKVTQPKAIRRIGLRYVNHIVVPGEIEVVRYFPGAPRRVEGLPESLGPFFSRLELIYDDQAKLLITFAAADAPEDSSGFLLDLDVIIEPSELALADAAAKLEDLHTREKVAFEALISDDVRKVLDGD